MFIHANVYFERVIFYLNLLTKMIFTSRTKLRCDETTTR